MPQVKVMCLEVLISMKTLRKTRLCINKICLVLSLKFNQKQKGSIKVSLCINSRGLHGVGSKHYVNRKTRIFVKKVQEVNEDKVITWHPYRITTFLISQYHFFYRELIFFSFYIAILRV